MKRQGGDRSGVNPNGECPGYCNPFTFGLPWCQACLAAGGGKAKRSIVNKREDCVETSDGRKCFAPSSDSTLTKSIEIECTNLSNEKRDGLEDRSLLVDKRQGDWNCWEAADGQVHCIPTSIEKRHAPGSCWELEDGQIECTTTAPAAPPKAKRQVEGSCWELEDGQVECTSTALPAPPKEKRQLCWELEKGHPTCVSSVPPPPPPAPLCWELEPGHPDCVSQVPPPPPKAKRQVEGSCWELKNGQVECTTTAPPASGPPTAAKRQVEGSCWELEDGQVKCTTTVSERHISRYPLPQC